MAIDWDMMRGLWLLRGLLGIIITIHNPWAGKSNGMGEGFASQDFRCFWMVCEYCGLMIDTFWELYANIYYILLHAVGSDMYLRDPKKKVAQVYHTQNVRRYRTYQWLFFCGVLWPSSVFPYNTYKSNPKIYIDIHRYTIYHYIRVNYSDRIVTSLE